ncbi:ScyD/ScyE family protein [Isoptericola sp. NPDC019482]|uniref:ScyD/ScyE family protein n=1 Tax=Isoptericola sp. NPDC019482 TaxID=3154688 RepID=UPI003499CE34
MRRALTAAAATATALLLAATPAAAHGGKPSPKPPAVSDIADGLVTPLSAAVGAHGTSYVTQNFAGLLTEVDKRGRTSVVHASSNGEEVGGVSYRDRTLTFTETSYDEMGNPAGSTLRTLRLDRHGDPAGPARTVADIRAYENDRNPDGRFAYGFRDLPASCAAQFPEGFPAEYTGMEDSHPYATTSLRGTTLVADAGMNAILSVSDRGRVRTVAVLPPQPAVVSAEAAEQNGMPPCVAGRTYWFESVPTDVEVGPWGQLYVTTLPGGPEDDSLGARGAVYRVNPVTGSVREVADGFVSATNLAVSPKGDIYVAEMFGDRISTVKHGGPRTVVEITVPGAVEWSGKGLLATANAFDPTAGPTDPPQGRLVTVDLHAKHGHHGHHGR